MLSDLSNTLQQMTTVSLADVPLYLELCVMYMAYRLVMVHIVLKSIAKALKISPKLEKKFIHRSFDMIHYVVGGLIGILALTQRPYGHCFYWAKDCKDLMWQNPEGFEVTILEKIYYFVFFVYYSTDIFFVGTTNQPFMLIIHHLVTLSEVANCVVLQSPVVGLSVMLLHDITDMPLYVGKVLLYCGSKVLKDYALVTFAILCTYFRIFNYPMIVYNVFQVGWGTSIHPWIYYVEECFLVVLYMMHLIWEYKIFTNVVGVIKGEAIHDNRSD
ncbi:longevity assurance protein [Tritrichomonas foetus]|uniref:Longevity assurance protein n=1 Tax=Tritrichomonas foetus TaxID=1144522 RepID=A0A1J4JVA5_9EUKA|nr:longevity assurance protein [Tritrichomonas foetus]|eukprot:OHT01197.1 longevity assurance protein [Tritrichomonas foetus]